MLRKLRGIPCIHMRVPLHLEVQQSKVRNQPKYGDSTKNNDDLRGHVKIGWSDTPMSSGP